VHSFTEENYLKAIFKLQHNNDNTVSNSDLSKQLEIQSASVTDMLKKMAKKKLIHYEKSKGVKLTEKGKEVAISIVRKHRIWELFLVQKLQFGWEEVHEIAEQLEHIHSEELINRLDSYLGHPKADPHGDPIPSVNGELSQVQRTTLSEVDDRKSCQVVGVKDSSTLFLQYLQQVNIGIGTKIKVIERFAFDGSIIIKLKKGEQISVSKKFADNVLVTS